MACVGTVQAVRNAEFVTGRTIGYVGIAKNAGVLVLGTLTMAVILINEVPKGHTPISFRQLKDDGPNGPRDGIPIPNEIRALDGKKVFIKGYVHNSTMGEAKEFILVGDMGECCFGDTRPKLTDMIQVKIVGKQRVSYSLMKRKFGGVLHVDYSALNRETDRRASITSSKPST